jgi:nucleotidyltransferase substrate binding protein (TIGR01987 family)
VFYGRKKIVDKIAHFEKAVKILKSVMLKVQQTPPENENYIFFRDSLIQRFEYCTDMFWKMVREFIVECHGIDAPASPKGVLKQAFDLAVIDEDQYRVLIASVNDRNLSSHAYHEKVAEQIALHIFSYFLLMQEITEKLKLSL